MIKFNGANMTREEFRNRLAKAKYDQNDPSLKEANFKYVPPVKKGF